MTNYGKSIVYKIYAFIAYLVPMLILFFCNLSEYTSDSRLSFFGILIIGFLITALSGTIKKIFNYNISLSISASIFIVALISYYMGEKLLLISGVSFIGSALSSLVGAVADTYMRLAYIQDEGGRRRKDTSKAISDKEAWRETYLFGNIKGE